MLDVLCLLDQAITFSQNKILPENIKVILGIIDTKKIITLLEALATNNAKLILEIIAELVEPARFHKHY
jgi:DNA polymerase III gamma/tau subunit